jgi:hypothetical protein
MRVYIQLLTATSVTRNNKTDKPKSNHFNKKYLKIPLVIRNNGKKKGKRTNKGIQPITQKTKDLAKRTH